jgi:SAM-dependent methyltransferase
MENKYTHEEKVHNTKAASIVVPVIMEKLKPTTVLDVGCGIGTWLSEFTKHNVQVKGIDGDYVNKELLEKYLDIKDFIIRDLSNPFDIEQKFDLVISLEVAEHLPESSADDFIESLARHGNNILFSAAVPNQDGQNHLNEQWQSYWVRKFQQRGYKVYDWLRPLIWENSDVDFWYRQNVLFFSKADWPLLTPVLTNIILPEYWSHKCKRYGHYKNQVQRIRDGKVGFFFYVKGLFRSLKYAGRKIK